MLIDAFLYFNEKELAEFNKILDNEMGGSSDT